MSETGYKNKPNIVFITFDSGRADRMGFLGYKKNTTPFLDSLARKGVYFKRVYSTGPGSSVSFTGIFTSTYPLDYGGYSYIDKPRVLLSEILQKAGYFTVGLHSSPYLSAHFGYARGWDEFRYLTYFGAKRGGTRSVRGPALPAGRPEGLQGAPAANGMSPGLRKGTAKANFLQRNASLKRWLKKYLPPIFILYAVAERILLLLRKILKDLVDFRQAFYTADEINEEVKRVLPRKPEKPLFLWLHYLDAHAPYALFAKKKGGAWLRFKYWLGDVLGFLCAEAPFVNRLVMPLLQDLYDESLRYVDRNAKELFDYLQSIGLNEKNSIFVFCADHGEAFLEHGNYGHEQKLFNENIRVPLVFYGSGVPVLGGVDHPVSLIDASPTILSLAGIAPPESYKGKSLFAEDGRGVVSQASECEGDLSGAVFTGIVLIRDGYKLIHWKNKRYLFSLEDEKEKKNLYKSRGDIARKLEAELKYYVPKNMEMQS